MKRENADKKYYAYLLKNMISEFNPSLNNTGQAETDGNRLNASTSIDNIRQHPPHNELRERNG